MSPQAALIIMLTCLSAGGTAGTAQSAEIIAHPDTFMLTSSDKALWLVRLANDGKSYDIVAKPTDQRWRWITQGVQGLPVAATATNAQLHLIFADPPAYLLYDLDRLSTTGRSPSDTRWPGKAKRIALCQAEGLVEGAASSAAVVAVVPRHTGSDSKATLGIFLKSGTDWQHLADCPFPLSLGDSDRLMAAMVDNVLYVLVAGDNQQASRLLTYERGRWSDLPLEGWPDQARAIGMLSSPDKALLGFVRTTDLNQEHVEGKIELLLGTYDNLQNAYPVAGDGQATTWPLHSRPLLAGLADQLALVWAEEDKLLIARCTVTGNMQQPEELDVLTKPAPDGRGRQVREVFMWGLLIGILAAMFLTRTPTAGPFVLPPTMRPASLVRRVLAAMVDFVPLVTICATVFGVETPSFEELRRQLTELGAQEEIPANLAYFMVASHGLYAAYGTAMEYRFGATLGKMLFRIRVVGQDGVDPGLREVLLRNLVRTIEISWPLVGIPVLLIIFTRKRQRLGDMMARTTVIHNKLVEIPALNVEMPDPHDQSDQSE